MKVDCGLKMLIEPIKFWLVASQCNKKSFALSFTFSFIIEISCLYVTFHSVAIVTAKNKQMYCKHLVPNDE